MLRQACPHCECRIGPLDSRSRRDRCSRCGQSLVPNRIDPASDSRMMPREESVWPLWTASALGELLAAAPQISCPPGRERLARTVRLCVERCCSGNGSNLARLMRVGRGAVSRWQRAKTTPGLPLLLSLAYRLGISLPDLLLECPTFPTSQGFVQVVPVAVNARSQLRRERYGWRINHAEVSPILQTALRETPPPSVERVMRRLRHGRATIYRHFPDLCHQIARHYAEYRAKCALATSRHRTSCQRDKTHAPVHTPVAVQLRLSQPRRGTHSPAGGPPNARSVEPAVAEGLRLRSTPLKRHACGQLML